MQLLSRQMPSPSRFLNSERKEAVLPQSRWPVTPDPIFRTAQWSDALLTLLTLEDVRAFGPFTLSKHV